ncbi:hypothetical protein OGAPHI_000187 [Ogataea philodendri]|uniref:Flavin reductase like domain-containing protein n=1 Tax=Ogataea philodendri TaxID=1378263 RepID=A0A9P8PH77_9ASCO|nr:uncharacterized protein OGAPHI_000187 [Ogataea philodendri]KAH3671485.1 hypothetical protein OGAPHI_000187 [Ogataea philodendri]
MTLPQFEKEEFKLTTSPNPNWKPGSGANDDEWKKYKKIELDPYSEGRTPFQNYRLFTSAVAPRPIGFISTVSSDGHFNLAPFSYFCPGNYDPPIFMVGISCATQVLKDTCKNLLETGECTVSLISEWFIEAANFTCTNAPRDVDEWKLSGLTKAPSTKVKPPHVAESAFSIEAKVVQATNFDSKTDPSKKSGTIILIEGLHFHVREDIADETLTYVDINKLKPVARLGGNVYSRVLDGFDLPRPNFQTEILENPQVSKLL